MKTIKYLCGMLAVLAFTACSSNSDGVVGNDNPIWHVTLQASMGDATNRALSESGDDISASFTAGDVVKVLKVDGSEVGILTAKTAGASTTLDGTIEGTFAPGEELTLRYLSATPNYDGQVGTLAGISSYAEGTLTVSTADPLTFTSSSVSLAPMQSITKFSFKDGGSNAISVTSFRIAATGLVQSIAENGTETVGTVTCTLGAASSEVYVALRNSTDEKQIYTFFVRDNAGKWYMGTKKATLENGKNYAAGVTLSQPVLTSSSAEGTIGIVDGLPAIVVNLGGTIGKKAVALMNAGATWPEDYGEYYTYANLSSAVSSGWYVPTEDELDALITKSNAWTTLNGVNGRLFEGQLFLPAAGFIDNEYLVETETGLKGVSTWGYYWSSTPSSEGMAYYLYFSISTINAYTDYRVDALTVRPFHSLE